MAETLPRDRLYPSLLDRLIDNEPGQQSERRDARSISGEQLRAAVLRDINWLFNATRPSEEFTDLPEVAASVINYGLPAISGRPASSLHLNELTRALRELLLVFEPRLVPATVRIIPESRDSFDHNVLSFKISAQIWAQPIPLEIYLRTDVDLESGQTRVYEAR